MANSRTPIIQIPEEEEDIEFLCQLDAAEAQALLLSSYSKRRRIAVDTTPKSENPKPLFGEVIEEEGAYTAALKGSKSLTWQKHQQISRATQSTVTTTVGGGGGGVGGGGGGGGGACFKCGVEGHWARDCPQTTSFGVNYGSVAPSSMAVVGVEKACPCGMGSCLVLTANTERNRGRKFFRCPNRQENGGCGFFEWCDETSEKIASPEDKAWKNGGQQQFYQRPTNQPNQAASGFTRSWNDFDRGTAPNTSYGQKFEATDNKSYGVKSGSSCFKCGQEGHWAKDCPTTTSNVAAGAIENQKFEATDNRSYGMKSGSSCFKCSQEGHWAKDCPTTTSNVAAGAIGNQSSGTCYKCGQAGHWARDCSQSQGQSTKLHSW
ncbi:DNA-binding protein HEXBP-like isoform X2 [Chenopodium quinoa]|uniref:DNA-binding protein HEXBP-like isoform X2 n=1 Tax=Chenopodium quinoa TaxID=63459 RepID=UPI000B78EFC9|nr:DNA-binding protein HEXBP-like isoform X2 [Chenopodium quinoa]